MDLSPMQIQQIENEPVDDLMNKKIDQIQPQTQHQQANNCPQINIYNQQVQVHPEQPKQTKPETVDRHLFMSLQAETTRPLQCMSQQVPYSLEVGDDEPGDEVTIVSASVTPETSFRKRKRRRRKYRAMRALEIDSKQESVEEIRQQAPKPCIQLEPPQPMPIAHQIPMTPFEQQKLLQNLYLDEQASSQFADVAAIFKKMVEAPIQNINQQPQQFEALFQIVDKISQKNHEESIKAFSHQGQINQGEILQIPKIIAQIPPIIPLINYKIPEICQQYVMITCNDILTGDQQKFELRKLIKSNYKQQISLYILSRILHVDASYNYANVEILKMIKSGYVWDNVIPYMAESLYKDMHLVKVRLLPEKSNQDFVSVIKYQAFLIMCQMFFGILPRQIATFDLPISFGEIMTIGENDSNLAIENKLAKLKCILHYFSSILREKQTKIKDSVEFIAFQRFRYSIKKEALCPHTESDKIKYRNVRLTDHLAVSRVKYGNQFKKEIALYLTHQNPCRQSIGQSLQTPHLMEETYRMMYSRPEIFILRALTPKLDLGQAIIVHGLEEFSKCNWEDERKMTDEMEDELSPRKFVCGGLLNEVPDYDAYGKRKGAVILIMSKLLFNQTYIKNDRENSYRINENYSFRELKTEIQTLYSAFQGRKNFCAEDERILISERYIKFIQNDHRWLYFIIVWIASSIAKVKCIFEFRNSEDENQAVFLMKSLQGWSVEHVLQALNHYRETLIQAHENWNRYVERVQQDHPMLHNWNSTPLEMTGGTAHEHTRSHRRVTTMTFLDFLKELYL